MIAIVVTIFAGLGQIRTILLGGWLLGLTQSAAIFTLGSESPTGQRRPAHPGALFPAGRNLPEEKALSRGSFRSISLEVISKPIFRVILNQPKELKLGKNYPLS